MHKTKAQTLCKRTDKKCLHTYPYVCYTTLRGKPLKQTELRFRKELRNMMNMNEIAEMEYLRYLDEVRWDTIQNEMEAEQPAWHYPVPVAC